MMKRFLTGVLSIIAGTALVLTSFAGACSEDTGSVNGPPAQETPSAVFRGPSGTLSETETVPEPEPEWIEAVAIALIHSELSEALEEERAGNRIRPGDPVPMIYYSGGGYVATAPTKCCVKPEGVAVELADAVIRIADLCGHLGINLDAVIAEKMAYNAGRPYKHGKRF